MFALVRLSLRDGSLALCVLPLDLAQHRLDVAVHTPQLIGENLWPRVSRWRRAGDASSDASHVPGGGGCASKLPTPDVVPHTRHVQRTMRASSVPTFRLGIGKYDISTRRTCAFQVSQATAHARHNGGRNSPARRRPFTWMHSVRRLIVFLTPRAPVPSHGTATSQYLSPRSAIAAGSAARSASRLCAH